MTTTNKNGFTFAGIPSDIEMAKFEAAIQYLRQSTVAKEVIEEFLRYRDNNGKPVVININGSKKTKYNYNYVNNTLDWDPSLALSVAGDDRSVLCSSSATSDRTSRRFDNSETREALDVNLCN